MTDDGGELRDDEEAGGEDCGQVKRDADLPEAAAEPEPFSGCGAGVEGAIDGEILESGEDKTEKCAGEDEP